jgi:WhiB family transcriptional regulator, redox-sensing transcriptional regulator
VAQQLQHQSTEWTWMFEAACRGMDAEIFFPASDGDDAAAKAVCDACPVRAACLAFAIDHSERFGIWGGLDEKQRARMTDEQREAVRREAAA